MVTGLHRNNQMSHFVYNTCKTTSGKFSVPIKLRLNPGKVAGI